MARKGCDWKRSLPEVKYYPSILQKQVRKTCQDSSPGGDSNWSPAESKPEMLPFEPTWWIDVVLFNLNSVSQFTKRAANASWT
jgi:hypothetical protein